jgi:spore germination protein KC
MNNRSWMILTILFSIVLVTGCWDRKELNERAIWAATGLDVADQNNIRFSGQVIITSGMQSSQGGGGNGNSGGKSFLIASETGVDTGEALQKIRSDLAREPFFGQRRVIMMGEQFARSGLIRTLDAATRSGEVALRTDMFIVKDKTAEQALNIPSRLEKVPAIAALRKHANIGGRADMILLDFLIDANSEGTCPTLPAIEIVEHKDKMRQPFLRLAGAAVFNQELKLAGFINTEENLDLLWILDPPRSRTISIRTDSGDASLALHQLGSKVIPRLKGDDIQFHVILTANGTLFENNTGRNTASREDLAYFERQFEKHSEQMVQKTIRKVQKKYGLDIFGFGEVIHRKHPGRWGTLKREWNRRFTKADIKVEARLKIKQTGLTIPSLWYRESERQ